MVVVVVVVVVLVVVVVGVGVEVVVFIITVLWYSFTSYIKPHVRTQVKIVHFTTMESNHFLT